MIAARSTMFSLVVALLVAAGVLLALPLGASSVPPRARFELVADRLGEWRGRPGIADDAVRPDSEAQEQLLRTYEHGTRTLWVAVGFHPFQSETKRPGFQALIYPNHGWSEMTAARVDLAVAGRRIPANLVQMRTGGRRLAILYWYQLGDHSVASDHVYRAVLVYRRLLDRRSDAAFVRVVAPVTEQATVPALVAELTPFVGVFYPELVRSLQSP